MKKIANLKGAKALNKNEMKAINGGVLEECSCVKFCRNGFICDAPYPCGTGYCR